jgi:3-oxoadipate enol-lactonase
MTALHVATRGPEDGAAVLCLHGGTGAGEYHWGRVAEALGDTYRCLLPDLPGHGRSPPPEDGRYDRAVLVEAVRDLVDHAGAPVHVAGFSMGGHAALALAASEPERFASLTLIGVSIREHDGLERWRAGFDPDRLEGAYPLWARTLAKIHEPLGGPDAWRDVVVRDASGLGVDVDTAELAALECPVLLIRGDRDQAVDPAQYAVLRDLWGDRAEECVVPAGGHDVQMTRAPLVEPAMRDFLRRATR